MKKFFRAYSDLKKFNKIDKNERKIVFYAENENSYLFFEGLIRILIEKYNQKIFYVTSSITDPILKNNNKNINSFFVGDKAIRTIFFQLFNSSIMILTMPELNVSYIKKSKKKVNYIYITHNILSIHMVFRKKAFNYYDTFFCVGPHHNAEITETEKIYKLNKINQFNFGYNKIDKLLLNKKTKNSDSNQNKTLIIAPSWGKDSILETFGIALLSSLVNKNWKIIIRPHPDTLKFNLKKYKEVYDKFKNHPDCEFEENISNTDSFYISDIMISDWSGSAFEFAFGLEKPVIFINLPKKINNSEFHLYQSVPIEINLRKEIGEVIEITEIDKIHEKIEKMYLKKLELKKKIANIRDKVIYNVGSSAEKGAEYIKNLI